MNRYDESERAEQAYNDWEADQAYGRMLEAKAEEDRH